MLDHFKIIDTGTESLGTTFFHTDRIRRYKFARNAINFLSSITNGSNKAERMQIDWTLVQRIGIFCQWGIGDAILMIPLLKSFRKVSNAKIELIGKPWLRELFLSSNICDYVHICVPPWTKFKKKYFFWHSEWRKYLCRLKSLRTIQFDLLISIRYDPREILQLRLLDSRIRAAYSACGGRPWLNIDFGVNPSMAQMRHVTYDATLAAEILTNQKTDAMPLLNVPPQNLRRSCKWLRNNGYRDGIILTVSPGSGNSIRRWPDNSYTKVLEDLPMSVGFVVVIVPPEENDKLDIKWPSPIPGAYWRGTLIDLQGILSVTDILLTVDSGVMHIGAACGCHIVAIFGPQLKQWFRPNTIKSEIIMEDSMPCRPCFDKCIYEIPICMKHIKEDTVKEAVHRAAKKISVPRINSFYHSMALENFQP